MIKVTNQLSKDKMKSKTITPSERKTLIVEGQRKILELSVHLRNHTDRNKNVNHINYKIHHLLHHPFTFVNAYAKISKNKGALTKGYDEDGSMKLFGLEKAEKIVKKIKTDKYKFKPVRRNWIPKPGRKAKRPVDVPTQSDRIVQEAIRGILEAIYEPEFKNWGKTSNNLSNNYGFRPGMSTWTALEKIKKLSQRCTIAIEGDIVSAYNHVDHKILLSILKKRIKDKKFLILIKNLLKSGIMDNGVFEHSLTGTPQGGIVSPLLFNIYLLGLDKFVYYEIILPILEGQKDKRGDPATKLYRKIRYQTERSYKRLQEIKKEYRNDPKPSTKKELKKEEKIYKKWRLQRNSTPYGTPERLERKALYVRYADDWVLALTCNQKEAENIKNKIANYLETERKMLLDEEKTKISRISKGYKFLGFEVRMLTNNVKRRHILQELANGRYSRILKRTTSRQLTIEPDSDRILKRLKENQICNNKFEPRAKPGWLTYEEYDIVEKYAQIFRGIYNYYLPCARLTRLNRISYILQYSCARCLARKRDTTLSKTFRKYGKNLKITKTIETKKKENVERSVQFLTLTDLRRIQPMSTTNNDSMDPFRIRQYWRTKIKLYQECCICGEIENIALHHLNSVRNIKKNKKDPHQRIRSTINRIQIPVCHKCHKDITYGKYNDPKQPIEFYNEFLAKL